MDKSIIQAKDMQFLRSKQRDKTRNEIIRENWGVYCSDLEWIETEYLEELSNYK
jgi:hypothetical protein